MNPEKNRDFENNMNQLLQLLKKLLKNLPGQPPISKFSGKSSEPVNLNVFFNFLPLTPEEFDAMEEAYEQAMYPEDDEWPADLTAADIEFLRKNGLRF